MIVHSTIIKINHLNHVYVRALRMVLLTTDLCWVMCRCKLRRLSAERKWSVKMLPKTSGVERKCSQSCCCLVLA